MKKAKIDRVEIHRTIIDENKWYIKDNLSGKINGVTINYRYYELNFQEYETVYRGSFSTVYKHKSKEIVLKKIENKKNDFSPTIIYSTIDEVEKIRELQDPDASIIVDYSQDKKIHMLIKMKCISGKNLFDFGFQDIALNHIDIKSITIQIINALGYIHKKGISHNDIKQENIIIDRFQKATIIDFGLASYLDRKTQTFTFSSKYPHIAPEKLNIITKKNVKNPYIIAKPCQDIFSLGFTILQFIYKIKNNILESNFSTFSKDNEKNDNSITFSLSILLKALHKCIEKEPKNRPQSIEKIISTIKADELTSYLLKKEKTQEIEMLPKVTTPTSVLSPSNLKRPNPSPPKTPLKKLIQHSKEGLTRFLI